MQELAAIKKVVDTLKPMGPDARKRAIAYISDLFKADATAPAETTADPAE
jgi:hypothetical protein